MSKEYVECTVVERCHECKWFCKSGVCYAPIDKDFEELEEEDDEDEDEWE